MQATVKPAAAVIAGQVEAFEPGAVIVPGITAVGIEGHTPGHSGYEIVSGKARLLAIGDTAHSSIVSLAKPDWTVQYDNDQAQGKAARRATLAALAVILTVAAPTTRATVVTIVVVPTVLSAVMALIPVGTSAVIARRLGRARLTAVSFQNKGVTLRWSENARKIVAKE